jgi:hypothetical protein
MQVSGVVQCQAGVVLEHLGDYLAEQGFTVPLDLGAKGRYVSEREKESGSQDRSSVDGLEHCNVAVVKSVAMSRPMLVVFGCFDMARFTGRFLGWR